MVDIRLIGILPTNATGVQQPPATSGATPQGAAIHINLPAGSILSGYIVNRDPSGNPILRTDKGDIVFSTSFFLKIGSEVVIRLENRASQLQAHILSVNGQSPEIAEQQSAFADEPDVIVGREPRPNPQTPQPQTQAPAPTASAPTPATIVRPSAGVATVTGTLLAPLPSAPASTAPALPPGTELTLKLVTIAQPAPPESAAPQPAPSPYTAYARTAATSATLPQTPTAPLPSAPIVIETPAAPPPIREGQTLPATVLGREPTGEIVVQTPVGMVRLQPSASLPPHSQVTFEVVKIASPAAQTIAPQPAASTPLTELARAWPALRDIVTLLSTPEPDMPPASPTLPLLLQPSPEKTFPAPRMTAGLMLFIAALRGGDFRNWLGQDNVEWLQTRGHETLLAKAEGDFATLARQFTQATQPNQWQPVFFPLVVNGQLEQARLFVKRDREKEKQSRPQPGQGDTRFVLEVDLSQLGEMQMDGFVRKRENAVDFDLVIRSLNPLPAEVERDILEIYGKTGELTGYKGQLLFQSVKAFPIHPMEELIAQHINTVIA